MVSKIMKAHCLPKNALIAIINWIHSLLVLDLILQKYNNNY